MNTAANAVPAPSRRSYSPPVLTVYGPATVLTQAQPASRPMEASNPPNEVRIFFLGDNA